MRNALRDCACAAVLQLRKYQERSAWLYENQDHPRWAELDEKARRSGVKFGEFRDELLRWLPGVDPYEVLETICVAASGQAEWEEFISPRPAPTGDRRGEVGEG